MNARNFNHLAMFEYGIYLDAVHRAVWSSEAK